jgi:hypothetical protein
VRVLPERMEQGDQEREACNKYLITITEANKNKKAT